MRASVLRRHGGPEVLEIGDWPDPQPAAGEVLVRVRACSLNRRDVWVRRGLRERTLPHVLGTDVAGEVVAHGAGVTDPPLGTKVVLYFLRTCGVCSACFAGEENLCPTRQVLGGPIPGGYAELLAIPRQNVFPIPGELSFAEACALPVPFLTAWHALLARCRLRPGELAVVIGGASGIGSAAIQIAKVAGATVIATAGSEEKRERCRSLGADHTIDHSNSSIPDEVRRLTGGRSADVIFEHVGTAVWRACLDALGPKGRIAACGSTSGNEVSLDLMKLLANEQTILGSTGGTRRELVEILRLVGEKRLRPVVDREFPLAEAAEAHRRMEEGRHIGKIVLAV